MLHTVFLPVQYIFLYFCKLKWFILCLGLVQKAKKAKDKLLKRDERPDTGSYESFYYGGVDPYMWEPQELGRDRTTGKAGFIV